MKAFAFLTAVLGSSLLVSCGGSVADSQSASDAGSDSSLDGAGGSGGGSAGSSGSAGNAGTGGGSAGAGGSADWAHCQGPGWCTKEPKGCCGGPCGVPKLSDFDGVSQAPGAQAAYQNYTCPQPTDACPGCMTEEQPNFTAFCENSSCRALDVREDQVSACETNADCVVRYPDCCEDCSPNATRLIALNKKQSGYYSSQVCSPMAGACPPCAPVYPDGYSAVCNAKKHCEVKANPKLCPTELPSGACSSNGMTCEYGNDIRISCRAKAVCVGGVWQSTMAKCKGLPKAGEAGCPAAFPGSFQECKGLEGTVCDMASVSLGALCECNQCSGGPCSQYGHWGCVAPPANSSCPAIAPNLGQACSVGNSVCIYGVCGGPTSAGRRCAGGVWTDEPVACPL